MSHFSPPGMKYNRSSLLSLENNYRHANCGAKTLTIKKLKSVYNITYITHTLLTRILQLEQRCYQYAPSDAQTFITSTCKSGCRKKSFAKERNHNFCWIIKNAKTVVFEIVDKRFRYTEYKV